MTLEEAKKRIEDARKKAAWLQGYQQDCDNTNDNH